MKATLPKVYSEEHSVWHGILNGDIKSHFVTQNALALSTLGVYHWQKGTDFVLLIFFLILCRIFYIFVI